MKPTSRRLLACTALASALLTGCGAQEVLDSEDPGAGPATTEPSEGTEAETALSIGGTSDGEASTTVESVVRGEGADAWLRAGPELEWLSTTVRTCVSAGGSTTEIGWYQWAAVGADGAWYPADLDYDRPRPTGQYPRLAELAPGECAEGRILIAIPLDAEVVTLVGADRNGVPQGTWLVGDVGLPAASDGA